MHMLKSYLPSEKKKNLWKTINGERIVGLQDISISCKLQAATTSCLKLQAPFALEIWQMWQKTNHLMETNAGCVEKKTR